MNYQEYIQSDLLILVPVMYFIGTGLKKSQLKDKWIPLALGLISIVFSMVWVIAHCSISGLHETAAALFTAATQGILIAGASVYANQLYIQSSKEE